MTTPSMSYIGGKSRLARRIIGLMPEHLCYCEPFAGGAAVFLRKDPSSVEVLNDLDEELVNFYLTVQRHPERVLSILLTMPRSRRHFEQLLRERIPRNHRARRAARLYYLMKNCFAGRLHRPNFACSRTQPGSYSPGKTLADILGIAERLTRVTLECLPWEDFLSRYDAGETFFYVDPPYLGCRYYRHSFGYEDHCRLAEALQGIRGQFLLSHSNKKEIRDLYRPWARIRGASVTYGLGRRRKQRERLICNFG